METIESRYGPLTPVIHVERDPEGNLLSVTPQGRFTLQTPLGSLTPQHTTDDMRRPKVEPLQFHPDGSLRNIALEAPTLIDTPLGPMMAELLTFYPGGALRRVFPLNGKLSGYWSTKEEATLTKPVTIATPAGSITAMLVGLQFHPSGALRSITLWPEETVDIDTPLGRQTCRIGLAFHENGALRSFEPLKMIGVPTPFGPMQAFEPDPLGIHGDLNSLSFHTDGSVAGLHTPMNTVTVTGADGARRVFSPGRAPSLCDENVMDVTALAVAFAPDEISFGEDPVEAFPTAGNTFKVGSLLDNSLGPIRYACGS